MKYIYLLFSISISVVSAQDLYTENFDGLSVGNVDPDFNTSNDEQGGFMVNFSDFSSGNTSTMDESNFTIFAHGMAIPHDDPNQADFKNSLKIDTESLEGIVASVSKDGIEALWNNRTTGNDVLQFEFDIFTGPQTNSNSTADFYIADQQTSNNATVDKPLIGLKFNYQSREVDGYFWQNNAIYDVNFVEVGTNNPFTIPADTWVRVQFRYESSTGKVYGEVVFIREVSPNNYLRETWTYDGLNTPPADTNMTPKMFLISNNTEMNATGLAATSIQVDNITVSAETDVNFSNNAYTNSLNNITSLYPNPANEHLTIEIPDNDIKKVTIMDLNGRRISSIATNKLSKANISISDLSTGVYLVETLTDKGYSILKFMKQ